MPKIREGEPNNKGLDPITPIKDPRETSQKDEQQKQAGKEDIPEAYIPQYKTSSNGISYTEDYSMLSGKICPPSTTKV